MKNRLSKIIHRHGGGLASVVSIAALSRPNPKQRALNSAGFDSDAKCCVVFRGAQVCPRQLQAGQIIIVYFYLEISVAFVKGAPLCCANRMPRDSLHVQCILAYHEILLVPLHYNAARHTDYNSSFIL